MVRSHSRLPISRPAAVDSPYGRLPPKHAFCGYTFPESRMFKFLGSAVGIIFLVGLVVVILLLKFIF